MWWDPLLQFEHKLRRDEIILKQCPFCGNQRYNLEVSKTKEVVHCWACGWGGKAKTFLLLNKLPADFDGWVQTVPETKAQKKETVGIDTFVRIDWKTHEKMLKSKGICEADIDRYNLLYATEGKYKKCLIIPLYEGNRLVYTVARHTILGRYLNPIVEKKALVPYYLGKKNRYMLYLCEGALDAIVINKCGFSSAPLLGTQLSEEQIDKIKSFGFNQVVVALDGDVFGKAIVMCDKLNYRGIDSYVLKFDLKDDPNDLFVRDNGAELIKTLITYHKPELVERLSAHSRS